MNDNRIIKLEGAKNIRDLGGIETKRGVIKSKKILRGNSLDRLTPKDIKKLTEVYNLKNIIDLRTTQEKKERPDVIIPNVNYLEMPIFDKKLPGITHEKGVNNGLGTFSMAKLYEEIFRGEYLDNINEILKTIMVLSEKNGATLFHCTAGKDRTGIITALLLMILGASEEDIFEDYLYTNRINIHRIRKYSIKSMILGTDKKEVEQMKNIMLAKEEYIQTVFDFIDDKWNNIDDFINNCLQIDEKILNSFIKNVIKK